MSFGTDREQTALVEDLSSADDEIRRLAVERLLGLPASEAIPRLVHSLGDTSWRVRKAAVERLVDCSESAQVVSALIAALGDGENPGRRNAAVEALIACGRPVVAALTEAFSSDDVDVRKLIVDALAGIGDQSVSEVLIRSLGDPDANVRAAGADALGMVGGDAAAEALCRIVKRDDELQLVRLSALRSLARLEYEIDAEELSTVLEDSVLRPAGLALLGYCDDHASLDWLLKGLESSSRASREAAMEALLGRYSRCEGADADALARRIQEVVRSTDGLVPLCVERLVDADLTVRLMLVQFLGLVGAAECVIPILESSRDEAIAEVAHATLEVFGDVAETVLDDGWSRLDGVLRRSTCVLFARTRGSRGTVRLRAALDASDGELRAVAARALGERGAAEAAPDMVRRLEIAARDDEPDAGEELDALIEALVSLAGRSEAVAGQIIDLLAARLGASSEVVREAMARVLARIARASDVERVTGLLKDPNPGVRRLAVDGLARLDPEAGTELLRFALADESPLVRMASAAALGSASREGVLVDLQQLVRDEEPAVCAAALRAIGSHCAHVSASTGDSGSSVAGLELLAAALSEEGVTAMAAIEALEIVGGQDAAARVVAALQSEEPEVVQAAVACVGRHGSASTLADLIPLIQHPSWAVRSETIQVLADRRVASALPAILRRSEVERDSFVRDCIVSALNRLEG